MVSSSTFNPLTPASTKLTNFWRRKSMELNHKNHLIWGNEFLQLITALWTKNCLPIPCAICSVCACVWTCARTSNNHMSQGWGHITGWINDQRGIILHWRHISKWLDVVRWRTMGSNQESSALQKEWWSTKYAPGVIYLSICLYLCIVLLLFLWAYEQ